MSASKVHNENGAKSCCNNSTTSFVWTTNGLPLDYYQVFRSPIVSGYDNIKWCLDLCLVGEDSLYDGICLFLRLISCNEPEIKVKYKLSNINATNKEDHAHKQEYNFQKGQNSRNCLFIRRDDFKLDEGALKFLCEIDVLSSAMNTCKQSVQSESDLSQDSGNLFYSATNSDEIIYKKRSGRFKHGVYDKTLNSFVEDGVVSHVLNTRQIKSVPELSQDFCDLLDNANLSDVTLCVGGSEFKVHKAILAARSTVFAAMFEHEMMEAKLNSVTITDIGHEVLKEMLHFIYTDTAPNINNMAYDLLAAGDKYDLEKLKLMCTEVLKKNLSTETAAETLIAADRHNAVELKAHTKHFINMNYLDVMETQGWKNMIAKEFQRLGID